MKKKKKKNVSIRELHRKNSFSIFASRIVSNRKGSIESFDEMLEEIVER